MLGLETLCAKLPASLESIKPVLIYPVAGVVLIGLFVYLVNPVVGAVNEALYAGLEAMSEKGNIALGAALAGLMSGDMGGRSTRPRTCSARPRWRRSAPRAPSARA